LEVSCVLYGWSEREKNVKEATGMDHETIEYGKERSGNLNGSQFIATGISHWNCGSSQVKVWLLITITLSIIMSNNVGLVHASSQCTGITVSVHDSQLSVYPDNGVDTATTLVKVDASGVCASQLVCQGPNSSALPDGVECDFDQSSPFSGSTIVTLYITVTSTKTGIYDIEVVATGLPVGVTSKDGSNNPFTLTVYQKLESSQPQVILIPTSGMAPVEVSFIGTGFSTCETCWKYYYYWFVPWDTSTNSEADWGEAIVSGWSPQNQITLNNDGGFSGSFTIPAGTQPGTYAFWVFNGEGDPSDIYPTFELISPSGGWTGGGPVSQSSTLTTALWYSPANSGSVTPNCPNGCSELVGSSITVVAKANPGFQFYDWMVEGLGGAACPGSTCTFTMPSHAVTLIANFNPTNLPPTGPPSLSLSPSSGPAGAVVTLSGQGYHADGGYVYCLSTAVSSNPPCIVATEGSFTADGSGNIPSGTTLTVPSGTGSESYYVIVYSGWPLVIAASAPFTVTSQSTGPTHICPDFIMHLTVTTNQQVYTIDGADLIVYWTPSPSQAGVVNFYGPPARGLTNGVYTYQLDAQQMSQGYLDTGPLINPNDVGTWTIQVAVNGPPGCGSNEYGQTTIQVVA
jgi:hypothetical protein